MFTHILHVEVKKLSFQRPSRARLQAPALLALVLFVVSRVCRTERLRAALQVSIRRCRGVAAALLVRCGR
eukprot:COSAG05_NODE_1863_length_3942_cov_2.381473_5_plen_70_part_00